MKRRAILIAAAAAAACRPVAANQDPLWSELHAGGVTVLMRHAQTVPGVGDPAGFRLDDCSTQRNLSDDGRRQAARVGAAFAARQIVIDEVLSSQWCRCLETARLAFPRSAVQPFPALNSFFDDRSTETEQSRRALARIRAVKAPANAVFVTHHVNIVALTGIAVGSGEAVLVRPGPSGLRVIGRLAL